MRRCTKLVQPETWHVLLFRPLNDVVGAHINVATALWLASLLCGPTLNLLLYEAEMPCILDDRRTVGMNPWLAPVPDTGIGQRS